MSLRHRPRTSLQMLSAVMALPCLVAVTVPSACAQPQQGGILSSAPAERALAVSGNMAPVINVQPQTSAAEGTFPSLPITVYDADPGDILTITVKRGCPHPFNC